MTIVPTAPGAAAGPASLRCTAPHDRRDTGFDDLVEIAMTVCAAETALISLVTEGRQQVEARIGVDRFDEELVELLAARIADDGTGNLVVMRDLAREPRTVPSNPAGRAPQARFCAGAALRSREGHVLGMLCVLHGQPRPDGLSPVQESTLRALARQSSALLELGRTVRERDAALEQRRLDAARRESLMETQAAIAAAAGDLATILSHLVAGAMSGVPRAEGGVFQFLEDDAFVFRATRGSLAPHLGFRTPLRGTLAGHAAATGRGLLVADASADPRANRAAVERVGLRAGLFVPVRAGDTVVGVLMLQSSKADAFNDRDLETVRLYAATAPLALAEAGQAAARREVRDSERRHRAIFESAIDYAIVALDLEGKVTNWNEGACRILGWSADEALGQPVAFFFTPEDREAGIPAAEMGGALSEGRGADERWHLRKNGKRFWANGEMMALRDDAGSAIGFIKILRDRTEQRQAAKKLQDSETALREEQSNLRTVLDTIPVGILFAQAPEARIIGGNKRLEEMIGHPLAATDQAASLGLWQAFHPDGQRVRSGEFPIIRIIKENIDHAELECEHHRPDGTRWWMKIVGASMRDPDGTLRGAVVAISDDSARHRADDLQTLMNHELSHRLKNLLTVVQAITRQTIRSASDMGELQRTLGDRLMVLGSAHDILLGGGAEKASLAEVIRGGVGVLGEAATTQLTMSGPDLEVGAAAALPLGLMMHELSTNAVKYGALSTPRGTISVTWSVDDGASRPTLDLLWLEADGPTVVPPTRNGFGSSLITRGLGALRGAAVTLHYPPSGLECRVAIPLGELARSEEARRSG